ECTHLVTDRIRRTMKFLCALSTAKHIVSVKWLDACKREAAFADEGKYMLNDKNSEKQYGFSLSKSLREARTLMESATDGDEQPPRLLTGVKIYATPSVQPPANELKEIVHAAGGEVT
ncbi:BRCT domain-containing protein, partial [Cladochytrium replicatum]